MEDRHIIILSQSNQSFEKLVASLEELGCDCLLFDQAEEVLAQCEWLPPDVLVIDFDMPGVQGVQFLRRLSQCLGAERPAVIVVARDISEELIIGSLEYGVEDFISKPVSVGLLRAKLKKLCLGRARGSRTTAKSLGVPKFVGRYQIIGKLGQGGMGTVYLAKGEGLEREVAIKAMIATPKNLSSLLRFRREIDLLIGLDHPNLIRVFDAERSKDPNLFYYVMEYIRGPSLETRIRQQGPTRYLEVVKLCYAIAGALDHIHKLDLVHRDIKPANILICPDKGPILSDFGLSKSKFDKQLTETNQLVGTPDFMAPEYILGKPQTNRSDLFALGMVCIEMLLGTHVFTTDNSYTIMRAVVSGNFPKARDIETKLKTKYPETFCNIIDRLVSLDPAHRFSNAKDLQRALCLILRKVA